MTNKLKSLLVIFDNHIHAHEIPAFRGAVIDRVGRENTIFHNHREDGSNIYQYPLIQYKQVYGKPAIYCLSEGVDEIHKFFSSRNWTVDISGRKMELKIFKLNMNQFRFQVWDHSFRYRIKDWVALNTLNYKAYRSTTSDKEKTDLLERVLKGNILSMAKGVEWDVDKQINLNIETIERVRPLNLKNVKVLGFDVVFTTNAFLPEHIGLGKSISFGFGTVRSFRKSDTITIDKKGIIEEQI